MVFAITLTDAATADTLVCVYVCVSLLGGWEECEAEQKGALSLQAEAVVIAECANCATSTDVAPAAPALAALPGLTQLQKFRGFKTAASLGSIIVKGTAFTDLSSLSGVRCTPGFYQITNNPRLASFNGFNNIQIPTFLPGPTFFAQGNPLLNYQSVSQIKQLAGCPGNLTSPFFSTFYVITAVCVLPVWAPLILLKYNFTPQHDP